MITPTWESLEIKKPPNKAIVFITDGKDFALAEYSCDTTSGWFNGKGFGGYEWEFDFSPTHWAFLGDIQLPI